MAATQPVAAPVATNASPEAAMKALFGDPVIVKGKGFDIKQSELDQVLTGAKANAAAQGQQLPPEFSAAILNQLITIQSLLQKATPADRAAVLAALASVDGVCIFTDVTATRFLAAAQPDIYVKGGDYTLETLNQDERRAVESADGKIVLVPFVPGKSTTSLLEKISRL